VDLLPRGIAFLQFGLTSLAISRYEIWFPPALQPRSGLEDPGGVVILKSLDMAMEGLLLIVGLAVSSRAQGFFTFGSAASVLAIALTAAAALGLRMVRSWSWRFSPPSGWPCLRSVERRTPRRSRWRQLEGRPSPIGGKVSRRSALLR
jgi:hypothetical protein